MGGPGRDLIISHEFTLFIIHIDDNIVTGALLQKTIVYSISGILTKSILAGNLYIAASYIQE
jgi:hypothetical protein